MISHTLWCSPVHPDRTETEFAGCGCNMLWYYVTQHNTCTHRGLRCNTLLPISAFPGCNHRLSLTAGYCSRRTMWSQLPSYSRSSCDHLHHVALKRLESQTPVGVLGLGIFQPCMSWTEGEWMPQEIITKGVNYPLDGQAFFFYLVLYLVSPSDNF